MNQARMALVREIITALASTDIQASDRIDAHGEYAEEFPKIKGDWLDMTSWCTDHECGTAACLAGWLGRNARIQAEGLTLEPDSIGDLLPVYRTHTKMNALAEFLEIHRVEATYIFGPDWPNSFSEALKRIGEVERGKTIGLTWEQLLTRQRARAD